MGGDTSNPSQVTQHLQIWGNTSNPSQVTQHLQIRGDILNPKIPILMTQQKLPILQGGETFQTPAFGDKQHKAKVHRDFNLLDHKFKPKEGSTLMSQERIEDFLNSILEGQERINEELAQISWIANFALQFSLANQSMLSTLCQDNSPKLKKIPHFQFLNKRARDFNKLSFNYPLQSTRTCQWTQSLRKQCLITSVMVQSNL